jgi:hypothetical protein
MKLFKPSIVFAVVFIVSFLVIPVSYSQNIPYTCHTPKLIAPGSPSFHSCPTAIIGTNGQIYGRAVHSGSLIASHHSGEGIAHIQDSTDLVLVSLIPSVLAGLVTYAVLDSAERKKVMKSSKKH